MANENTTTNSDITQERYKGPNSTIVGLGYFSAAHHILNFGAILGLGTTGYMFYESIGKQISKVRSFASKHIKGVASNWFGMDIGDHRLRIAMQDVNNAFKEIEKFDFAKATPESIIVFKNKIKALNLSKDENEELIQILREDERGSFQCLASDMIGILGGKNSLKKLSNYKKVEAGLFMAGFGMVASMIGSVLIGVFHGRHKGDQGRHQFERAQDQISNLKEDNADLNKINDDLHTKYVKPATRLDSLAMQADAGSSGETLATTASITPTNMEKTAPLTSIPEIQLDQPQHQGRLVQHELATKVA